MPNIVVIGAGIAGLTAARVLGDGPDVDVTVLEGSPEIGGKLRVSDVGGLAVDEGAEQVLVRVPEAVRLIDELGLGGDLVHPRTTTAGVWSRGRIRPLPAQSVLGVPADPVGLARSGVLSARGLLRAGLDVVLPRTTLGETDVSVGGYVAARVGTEVVERLVDPLLGGVYAGRAEALSLDATVPQLGSHVRAHRTLLAAARAARAATASETGPVFASIVGGLGRVPAAMTASTSAVVRTRATVRAIERHGSGFRLVVGDTRAPEAVDADAVVVAVPAPAAARLLADVAPYSAAELAAIETASVGIVTLVLPHGNASAFAGSGVLVPAVERRVVKAMTFSTTKWAHLDDGVHVVVRASVGRAGENADLHREDEDLVRAVLDDVAVITGVSVPPLATRVSRWGGAFPQYAPGHLDRVRRIRGGLPRGLVVCGAAYDGIGVPACIRSARSAAADLREWLHGRAAGDEEGRRQAGA